MFKALLVATFALLLLAGPVPAAQAAPPSFGKSFTARHKHHKHHHKYWYYPKHHHHRHHHKKPFVK
jgi:hypothetical protein